VAIASLSDLSFDEKVMVLLNSTGDGPSKPVKFADLVALVRISCDAFHRLGLMPTVPSEGIVEGLVSRAMLEQGRSSTGEAVTRYEASNMLRELASRSFELSRVLNAGPLAGSGMSSYMRTMMHPWQQLVRGLIGPADFQVCCRACEMCAWLLSSLLTRTLLFWVLKGDDASRGGHTSQLLEPRSKAETA
jgi:hypothetical protein